MRKVSGVLKPSHTNQAEFERAVAEVAGVTRHLVETLVTNAPPRDREEERVKAKARNVRALWRKQARLASRVVRRLVALQKRSIRSVSGLHGQRPCRPQQRPNL